LSERNILGLPTGIVDLSAPGHLLGDNVIDGYSHQRSKIYHLRWNPTDGFELRDLADVAYNPSSVVESSAIFDSTYDDMLIARIVTNASNVATITNLANKVRLSSQTLWRGQVSHALDWTTLTGTAVALNWARTPMMPPVISLAGWRSNETCPTGSLTPGTAGTARALELRVPAAGATRYAVPNLEYNCKDTQSNHGTADINITALAV
jgi:hypothetical protein